MEGRPNSLDYTSNSTQHNQESSSSKLPLAEKMRIGSGIVLNPTQTLDQFHQLYAQRDRRQEPTEPNLDPDPDLIPLQLTSTAGASNSNLPPLQPLPPEAESGNASPIRYQYRECQKNHAASVGRHVVDGCGEFMPSGEEGTPEALKCAACECHRNFHRRELEGGESGQWMTTHSYYSHNPNGTNTIRSTNNHIQVPRSAHHLRHHHHRHFPNHYPHNLASPNTGPMMMAFSGRGTAESSSEDLNMVQSGGQHVMVPGSKKRFRTKFTKEQKDRMHEVAEKLGWKIQKQDEEEVGQLCQELDIKKQVFKVWMHNNKQVMKKKQEEQ